MDEGKHQPGSTLDLDVKIFISQLISVFINTIFRLCETCYKMKKKTEHCK